MTRFQRSSLVAGIASALVCGFALSACSGGGGGGSDLTISAISVAQNQVWRINRPIEISFSSPVDLNSVNLNTVQIRQVNGTPSAGTFSYKVDPIDIAKLDKKVIVFQPVCPKLADFSDAGFLPGGVDYEIKVIGASDSHSAVVRGLDGSQLTLSHTVTFTTPTSTLLTDIFYDPKFGGPKPRVRNADPNSPDHQNPDFTYIEIGGDSSKRVYFQRDSQGNVTLESDPVNLPGGTLPLNLVSDSTTHVALVIFFDQPIDPSAGNISSNNVRWDFLSNPSGSVYSSVQCNVSLIQNCIDSGAIVRVDPQSALPPNAVMRGVVTAQFSDIVGERNLTDQLNFARCSTSTAPTTLADEINEPFDTTAHFDSSFSAGAPPPVWGGGLLTPSFGFTGTGGPQGTFDLLIPAGQSVIFDTVSSTFTGGPNFTPTATELAVGGVLDVRNLRIEAGATFKVQGPNPAVILATGKIEIFGTIDVSGTDNPGVATLNTTNIPEPGTPGQGGGGRGGTGSPLTNASSPKGGNGFGAFNQTDGGGEGGETGWNDNHHAATAVDFRRGAGGGGGVLGSNQPSPFGASSGPFDQTFIGLDAESGFPNTLSTHTPPGCAGDPNPVKGAISGQCPPQGGNPGPGPFGNSSSVDDFYGIEIDNTSGLVIKGELKKPWAGAGGGGGGDASYTDNQTFPYVPFNPAGDEKGSGGGGGGGSLHVLTLGDVVFGSAGQIKCRGGTGGGGENTNFFDRVGGGSGGGSGGHVIIETSAKVDFSLTASSNIAILATGAEGGAGRGNQGGATLKSSGVVENTPDQDACPPGYPVTGNNKCLGQIDGAGGDGGPGIIQIHVNDNTPGVDILLPIGITLDKICKPTPLTAVTTLGGTPTARLVPSFGRFSQGRSLWYPTGLGGFDVNSSTFKPMTVDFGGTDPLTGFVNSSSGKVTMLAPLIAPATVDANHVNPPFVDPANAFKMIFDASSLVGGAQDYYLSNPALLKGFLVELVQGVAPPKRYEIVAATYASNTQRLTVTVTAPTGENLNTLSGVHTAALVPAYFRVTTNNVTDALPSSATIFMQFEAAPADLFGNPDTTQIVGPVTDVSQLADPNGLLRFLRFSVTFDIDAQNAGVSASNPRPSISYLKLPFRY